MTNSTLTLVVLFLVNLMDMVIIYYLGHRLINKKVFSSSGHFALTILCGTFLGICAYLFMSNDVDIYIFRMIALILMLSILRLISKKDISNVFLIFVIIFLGGVFFQAPILLLVRMLDIHELLTSLLAQSITFFFMIFIGFRFSIYKLFNVIERQILLRLILFILSIVVLSVFIATNFEYSIYYLLYFSIFMVLSFLGFGLALARVFYYTNQIPIKVHDIRNLLIGVHMTAHSTSDIEKVRQGLDECMDLMKLEAKLKHIQANKDKENVLAFIESKKEENECRVKFVTRIDYHAPNETISLVVIVYTLGTLLDNAIEHTIIHHPKKPILVDISIDEDYLKITVANAYENREIEDFSNMFKKRYSTKGEGRGYGLYSLRKKVESYGGNITLEKAYQEEYQHDYLHLTVDI